VVENIGAALTYLFPGFLAYALLYRRLVPSRAESDLVLTAKSVIWSLAVNLVVGLPGALRHYRVDWTSSGTIAGQLGVACLSGLGFGLLERRKRILNRLWTRAGVPTTWWPDVWAEAFDLSHHRGGYVHVRLTDGSTYFGWVHLYTDVAEATPKELLLQDAWYFRTEDAKPLELGRPVLLRADTILAVEFAETGDELADAAPSTGS
jgi:hypothetical protein